VVDADGDIHGTAFFVGNDVALTVLDVVVAAGGATGKLIPAGASAGEAIVDVDRDEALGLALLRVESSPGRCSVALSDQEAVAGHLAPSRSISGLTPSRYN
jgi:hypothetical protein